MKNRKLILIQHVALNSCNIEKKKKRKNIELTRREHDVLVAISEELITQKISEKLYIGPKTVETHL